MTSITYILQITIANLPITSDKADSRIQYMRKEIAKASASHVVKRFDELVNIWMAVHEFQNARFRQKQESPWA